MKTRQKEFNYPQGETNNLTSYEGDGAAALLALADEYDRRLAAATNAVTVTESEVTVKTPDGTADCYFVHPSAGTAPGVLVWPDIFGLRPARRLASRARPVHAKR